MKAVCDYESDEGSSGNVKLIYYDNFKHVRTKDQFKRRMLFLWEMVYKKAYGSSIIINKYIEYQKKVNHLGMRNRSNTLLISNLTEHRRLSSGLFEQAKCLIKPENFYKSMWDIYVMFLLLYTAIWVPFNISFLDHVPTVIQYLDYFVDISFFIDICLTFNTTYYD